jgi:hypothetical protein
MPPLILFVQTAVAVASDGLGSHITQIGVAALLALNAWQIRATQAYRDDSRKLMQWAFGENGDNGANSKLKWWEKLSGERALILNDHTRHLEEHDREIGYLKGDTPERRDGTPDRRHG